MPGFPAAADAMPVLVVLAAGASSRLGAPKALADLAGSSVLERLLGSGAAAGLQERAVVGGCHQAEIQRALKALKDAGKPSARSLFYGDWAAGRTGSLARAVRAYPGRAIVLAPADVPLVAPCTFRALKSAWHAAQHPARAWIAPYLMPADPPAHAASVGLPRQRRFGHPVLLGPALAARTASLAPEASLRGLRDEAEPLLGVPVPDAGILDDLDTPEDLRALQERLSDSSGD